MRTLLNQISSSFNRFQISLGWWVILGIIFSKPIFGAEPVRAFHGTLEIPTYPWSEAGHPYFRGTDGLNIYPYPMLDNLSRTKKARTYRSVILENEFLRITFIPELGGKIHEVIDKTTGQPMFYVNNVIKPGLIGMCGAWTSGGVEWNTGPQGHTVSAMQPIPVLILPPNKDGSRTVAIGETERIYNTQWTVLVTLHPDRSYIDERIRISNPTYAVRPYYFWNCTAVPNTAGFQFVYPMTLGCDHGAEKFFKWPIDNGKDLSRGTNYQDASSIFAWYCDQDFFGSYDTKADRGIVACANHYQVPGKKAWTWGQGGFGRMHQMDLTDSDGPYNEVQTGPLLTQADVGRLDPSEAVSWQEWWYPIHGLGGFTFANPNLVVQAHQGSNELTLRILGTGTWSPATVHFKKDGETVSSIQCSINPRRPTEVSLSSSAGEVPLMVEIVASKKILASFRTPFDLPNRQPPQEKAKPDAASEMATLGWKDVLFARYEEAERHFKKALEKDGTSVEACIGLAMLYRDRNSQESKKWAQMALKTDPDRGDAWLALAVAEERMGNESVALDAAWRASVYPGTAVSGRHLVAQLLLRQQAWDKVIQALSETGPWTADCSCKNLLAYANFNTGEVDTALRLIRENLEINPLDVFAHSILWLAGDNSPVLKTIFAGNAESVLDCIAQYAAIKQYSAAMHLLTLAEVQADWNEPLIECWRAYLYDKSGDASNNARIASSLAKVRDLPASRTHPYQVEMLPVLEWAYSQSPENGKVALYMGHLLFHLGRSAEARKYWQKASDMGVESVIALRALGMASLKLDGNRENAVSLLTDAHKKNPQDPIVARDLAKILFVQLEAMKGESQKTQLVQIRHILKSAFVNGKDRSDFVTLLAKANNQLGDFSDTAQMLDIVRVTIWEGAREIHDLFEDAHMALGRAHLSAGRAAEALKEFNRALEYPENLATGKLENAREAHIHYWRGKAFEALGQKNDAIAAWQQALREPESKQTNEARRNAREALEKIQ